MISLCCIIDSIEYKYSLSSRFFSSLTHGTFLYFFCSPLFQKNTSTHINMITIIHKKTSTFSSCSSFLPFQLKSFSIRHHDVFELIG